MINYDWFKEYNNEFPTSIKEKLNIFDLAGFPDRELVVTNLLKFYFNPNQEHGFGDLFFHALLELLYEKDGKSRYKDFEDFEKHFSGNFTVRKEVDFIDLLITSGESENIHKPKEWAILIENKLKFHLHNDLVKYWKSVNAGLKIGVVLSLYDITASDQFIKANNLGFDFVNILYKDYVIKLEEYLKHYKFGYDERHLMLLKEFILNIKSKYFNVNTIPQMEEKLNEFQKHSDEIKEFNKHQDDLHEYVSRQLHAVMTSFCFYAYNWKEFLRKEDDFFPDQHFQGRLPEKHILGFKINIEQLLFNNILSGHYFIQDDFKYAEAIVNELSQNFVNSKTIWFEKDAYHNQMFIIGFNYDLKLLGNEMSLKYKLTTCLNQHFFDNNKIVPTSYAFYNSLLQKENLQ